VLLAELLIQTTFLVVPETGHWKYFRKSSMVRCLVNSLTPSCTQLKLWTFTRRLKQILLILYKMDRSCNYFSSQCLERSFKIIVLGLVTEWPLESLL
jgi:hypothetical protein